MKVNMYKRREFVRLTFLASLFGLAACGRETEKPILCASSETLPNELIRTLPESWLFKPLKSQVEIEANELLLSQKPDLLAIGDGWVLEIQENLLQPIEADDFLPRLSKQAEDFLSNLGPELSSRVFPIGVSPWVMLFRNGQDLVDRGNQGWDVLLDSELTGQVVLPESPRLVMSIAERIDDLDGLRKLRRQALTFDDRNGLNWVLSGQARVAVLPLFHCFGDLSRDPRLSISLPMSGTPLNWTLLVRPTKNKASLPFKWIEETWEMPLLAKLLARGWIPPLPNVELLKASNYISNKHKSIVLPPDSFWLNSWSLYPMSTFEIDRLNNLWKESTP